MCVESSHSGANEVENSVEQAGGHLQEAKHPKLFIEFGKEYAEDGKWQKLP